MRRLPRDICLPVHSSDDDAAPDKIPDGAWFRLQLPGVAMEERFLRCGL
jgi:hypothetical protein